MGPRKTVPPPVRKFLDDHKGRTVVGITVGTAPVSSNVAKLVDFLSLGSYKRGLKKRGYNEARHAYMVLTLDDGTRFKMEKNHVVEIAPADNKSLWRFIDKDSGKDNRERQLKVLKPIALNDFMANGEKYAGQGDKKHEFWQYDPVSANCQYYVDDLVTGNRDHIGDVDAEREFYFQAGASDSVKNVTKPIVSAPIDLAATLDRVRHGDGLTRLTRHRARRRHDDATYHLY